MQQGQVHIHQRDVFGELLEGAGAEVKVQQVPDLVLVEVRCYLQAQGGHRAKHAGPGTQGWGGDQDGLHAQLAGDQDTGRLLLASGQVTEVLASS